MKRFGIGAAALFMLASPWARLPLGSSPARAQEFDMDTIPPADDTSPPPSADFPVPSSAFSNNDDSSPPQQFYGALAPYGEWVYSDQYGWVWQPNQSSVGPDFQPYATNGTWQATEDGWAFDSSYPWSWAAFHYGSWYFADNAGWRWVPGNQWAPAWVDWRYGDGYVGWMPHGPQGWQYSGGFGPDYRGWTFVRANDITAGNVWTRHVAPAQVHTIFASAQPVNHMQSSGGARFNAGPPVATIRSAGVNVQVRPSLRQRTSIAAHPSNVKPPASLKRPASANASRTPHKSTTSRPMEKPAPATTATRNPMHETNEARPMDKKPEPATTANRMPQHDAVAPRPVTKPALGRKPPPPAKREEVREPHEDDNHHR